MADYVFMLADFCFVLLLWSVVVDYSCLSTVIFLLYTRKYWTDISYVDVGVVLTMTKMISNSFYDH